MRIASVSPVWNSPFLRPFLKQIDVFDENIILLGNEPFEDYLAAGLVSPNKGETEEILKEFPNLHIVRHDIKYYSGQLFNLGLYTAKALNCEVVVKLDPDMFLEKASMDVVLDRARNLSNTVSLNMKTHTMVYEQDLDHGVTQALWHVGGEPFVIRTDSRFIEDGTNISVDGAECLDWPIMIHHLSGFKRHIVNEVEQSSDFPGWTAAPQEIKDLFQNKTGNKIT